MKTRRKKIICPNCEFSLRNSDNFCSNCGQENHEKKASIKQLISDFMGDYFTFDSKFFRSAKLLLLKPGSLTAKFREGKQKSYIAPIRLYLFTSFIYFFCSQFLIDFEGGNNDSGLTINQKDINQEMVQTAIEEHGDIDTFIEKEAPGNSKISSLLLKKSLVLVSKGKNIQAYWFSKLSITILLMLPIIALVLSFIFWKNREFYVIHLVHITHIQSFTFIVLLVGVTFSHFFESLIFPIILLCGLPVYLFLSFRFVYQRSRAITLLKTAAYSLWFVALAIVGLFSTLVLSLLFS